MAAQARQDVPRLLEDVVKGDGGPAHARKLWEALLHSDQAGLQLAGGLLAVVQSGQTAPYFTPLLKFIREWSARMPVQDDRDAAEVAVSDLLARLAGFTRQRTMHGRQRVLQLLHGILDRLPEDDSVPLVALVEEQMDQVVEAVQEHLIDKDEVVRMHAVMVLAKLVYIAEGKRVLDNPTSAAIKDLLHTDLSEKVRAEVVRGLFLDEETLAVVLERTRDRSAKVAAAVYGRMQAHVPMQKLSFEQLHDLLWYGLREERPEAQQAAQKLLSAWFADPCEQDVAKLLERLVPQENPELCTLCLEQLVAAGTWDPQGWLKSAADKGEALADVARQAAAGEWDGSCAILPEQAFVSAHACRVVDASAGEMGRAAAGRKETQAAQAEASVAAEKELVLERFLPTAPELMQLVSQLAKAGLQHRYALSQVLSIASISFMTWADSASRAAAEDTLRGLVCGFRPDEAARDPETGSSQGYMPCLGCGGDGSWERSLLQLAAAVVGGNGELVAAALPWVVQLAQEAGVVGERPFEAPEAAHLQVLGYLQLLLVACGPDVAPSEACQLPDGSPLSLAQALDHAVPGEPHALHPSPLVRLTAVRCRVQLCCRDGGLAALPAAVALITQLVPSAALGAPAEVPGSASRGGVRDQQRGSKRSAQGAAVAATQAQGEARGVVHRAAVQGLVDLAMVWGVPAVDAALRAVEEQRRVAGVARQLAQAGLERQASGSGAAGGAGAAAVDGVVQVLLSLTRPYVEVEQGGDGLDLGPVSDPACDAVDGLVRLLLTHAPQRQLQRQLKEAARAVSNDDAMRLLVQLLVLHVSPAVQDGRPELKRTLERALGELTELAAGHSCWSAHYRSLLYAALPRALDMALHLPPPPSYPSTARSAAPALLEISTALLTRGSAGAAAGADKQDAGGGQAAGTSATQPVLRLAVWVLEEATDLLKPGGCDRLPLTNARAKPYVNELLKTPERLWPCLSGLGPQMLQVLAWLARRAHSAADDHAGGVVLDAALGKLADFIGILEAALKANVAPLTEEEVEHLLQELRAMHAAYVRLAAPEGGDEEAPSRSRRTASATTSAAGGSKARGGTGATSRRKAAASETTSGGGGSRARGGTSRARKDTQGAADRIGGILEEEEEEEGGGEDYEHEAESGDDSDDDFVEVVRAPAARKGAASAAGGGRARGKAPTASQGSQAGEGGAVSGRRSTRAAAQRASQRLRETAEE